MKLRMSILFVLIHLLAEGISHGDLNKINHSNFPDTLVIGNDKINLFYSLHDDIRLIGYRKENLESVYFNNPQPDFTYFQEKPQFEIKGITKEVVSEYWNKDSCQIVSIHYKLDSLEVQRVWKVYPGIPVISSYYYLKGKAEDNIQFLSKKHTYDLIEDFDSFFDKQEVAGLGYFPLFGQHWTARVVNFRDVTDRNNNLVFDRLVVPYVTPSVQQGNVLILKNKSADVGVFILKESPLGYHQQAYPGFDFLIDKQKVLIAGIGVKAEELDEREWMRTYGFAIGFSSEEESDILGMLHRYQKRIRTLQPNRDEMILSNTWGDRSKDSRMNEQFIMEELEAGRKLKITHFQLDDGWQQGLSKNSAQKAGEKWDEWSEEDWVPHKTRFPKGLSPIVEKADSLGIKLGLWFNPGSSNDYQNWLRDAKILVKYYRKYGIQIFKIDGIDIKTKRAEENLRNFFEYIMAETNGNVVFNLDVTAGSRGGYFYFNEYGNIFLENRYTDWANYYPFQTLRNLWQLSRYIPTEKFQIEWLNPWRNNHKYPEEDPLAPSKIPWDYQMAITFMAQPLAWMELSNLPEEAFDKSEILKEYKKYQYDLHLGNILPVGMEPDGFSWTGFQSVHGGTGYFLIFREKSEKNKTLIQTWIPPHTEVELDGLLGAADSFTARTDHHSNLEFELPSEFSFGLFRYRIKSNY